MKRIAKLSAITVVSLCVCMLVCFAASAANLSDIGGHWAKEYIEYGVEKGYISGYQDGTFLPDKTVTRAEFSKMINSAVKLTATGDAKGDFGDVASKDWFFEEVKKAENAGYITGYEDGTFRPNNSVTRQEAAVILSRIVLPIDERVDVNTFGDGNNVDSWAEDAVSMIAAKGYIKGDENKNFNPKNALTRSQAAKLICEFVKNENIINKNQKVNDDDGEVIYSETLFTDDLVIDVEDAEEISVKFKNCRVLGNVYVKNASAFIELENTSFKNLYIQADDAVVTADKNSSVKNAYVEYPAALTGDGFKNVVLSGEHISTGNVKLDGSFDKVEVSGNALVSADKVKQMTITDRVNATIMTGTVEKLTVESSAKGATVNLSSKTVVEKAENKAAVTYTGSGKIEVANNSVVGVVFDGVSVEKTEGKVADNGEGTGVTDDDFFSMVEVSPEKGKTNQSISVNTVFTFIKAVYDKDGEKLTADYVEDNFEIRKKTADGERVAFTATVASSSKKVTLNPVANLAVSTSYYVIIPAGTLTYEDGSKNDKYTTNFKTAAAISNKEEDEEDEDDEDSSASVTMVPKDNAKNVALSSTIKLTFSGTPKAYSSSKTFNASYIEDEAIKIYEGSASGDEVGFSASVSGKTVTLTPTRLRGDTEYFVVILSSKIKVGSETLSKTTLSFTTEEGTPITISPKSGATDVSTSPEITVTFDEPMLQEDGEEALTEEYIQDEVLVIKKGSSKETADDVYYSVTDIADNGRSFTIVPDDELDSATTYYIIIEKETLFGEKTESLNAKVTSSFKTASAMVPMFTPYDGKKNVSTGTEIKVSFSDELLIYATNKADRVPVDQAYLDELITGYEDSKGNIQGKNRIYLKRTGASKPLDITLTLDDDGRTIIITPAKALDPEKTYEISVAKNLFYSVSSDGKTYKPNSAGEATFDTNIAMSPTITPKNEAEDVALTVNPTIKFGEKIYRTDRDDLDELTAVYLKKAITFVDEYDNEVEFGLEIDGSTITVVPEEDLEGNVAYTLTLAADKIQNEDGVMNKEKTVTFTTKVSNTIEINTTNSPATNPTVKFGTKLFTIDGDEVTEEYAAEYIFITEGSKSSDYEDAIDATISISKEDEDGGRTYTIDPVDDLEFNTTYYVNVVGKAFLFADEKTENAAKNASFKIIKEPALTKVSASAVNSSSIKITFTSNVADKSEDELAKLHIDIVKTETGESVDFDPKAIETTSSTSITIKKLEKDTEYTFTVYVVYDDVYGSDEVEVTAKTKAS